MCKYPYRKYVSTLTLQNPFLEHVHTWLSLDMFLANRFGKRSCKEVGETFFFSSEQFRSNSYFEIMNKEKCSDCLSFTCFNV